MAGFVTIDGIKVPINGQRNLLEMVREVGIDLPTFCYHSELSAYGACRMCVVEDARGAVIASCSTTPADGMEIRTSTPRLMHIRRMMLELILANHDRECTSCSQNLHCRLQELCARFGVDKVRFPARQEHVPLDLTSTGLVRDPNKCILCGDCVRMCAEVQGIGAIDIAYRGSRARVTPAYNRGLGEGNCVNCGQCAAVCPTAAITVRSESEPVWAALRDPQKHVVAQVAPAVRVAIGEEFGLPAGQVSTGKLVTAIRRLGFDKVFDTCFTADLTTVEETNEFLGRLQSGGPLPLFTVCCPAWVKCVEQYYPHRKPQLSSCRSPQQMFGSMLKEYYPETEPLDGKELFVVSIMPCTAKKFEARRPEFGDGLKAHRSGQAMGLAGDDGMRDVDAVLTTQELAAMLRAAGIAFADLRDDDFDQPFGFASGAGVIFGQSGGVATAVAREAAFIVDQQRLTDVPFEPAPDLPGVRQAAVTVGGREVRVAVVSGLGNARNLIAALDRGDVAYDIIEVMACTDGCVGGGGQPTPNACKERSLRAQGLRSADVANAVRLAGENTQVQELYRRWLVSPNSETAHHVLHTSYGHRRRVGPLPAEVTVDPQAVAHITVCVGTSCYLRGARDVLRRFSEEIEARGLEDAVELKASFCLERCDRGPNVVVNGQAISHVREEQVPELLTRALEEAKRMPADR